MLSLVINGLVRAPDAVTGASRHSVVSEWPFAAQLVVTHDFYIYWFHRAPHRFDRQADRRVRAMIAASSQRITA